MAGSLAQFTGSVTHNEVLDLLTEAAVFVNPSYSEGLPSSVAEAMAVGLPVVAYNVGGTSELVQQGVNGCLVKPRDVNGLTAKIMELLNNQEMARRMGERGRRKIREEYQWSKVIDAYDSVILDICK